MTLLQAAWAQLRRAGKLLSESTDPSPQSGVWTTHVTRAAIVANVLLSLALIGLLALAWLAWGRPVLLLTALTLLAAAKLISLSGQAVALLLDRTPGPPPSNQVFLSWALLTALIGLPLGHLVLWLAPQLQPLTQIPTLKKFFPEFFLALLIGVRYWRLIIVRLWFERLAAEQLKRQAAEQGQALAESRLHMLQAHVEPQFLFNTLASVQQLVRTDSAQADRLLVQLVSYLRQAIPDARGSASTLGREMALVRTYLGIVAVRIGARLAVTVTCDPALEQVPFPSHILQALVENAVRHGADAAPGPVAIAVSARLEGQAIAIRVEDSGAGFGNAGALAGGAGLLHARERLALAYQGAARLALSGREGGGVCAAIHIPPP